MKTIFDRIGKRWKESIDKIKEYEIIEGKETTYEKFRPANSYSINNQEQEYQEAEKLKKRLLEKYEGKKLEEVVEGKEFETEKGICYSLENQDRITLKTINSDQARKKILSDLKMIPGIREITEHDLKRNGYKTIEDLKDHPHFSSEARRLLKILNERDTCQIVDWTRQRFPKSHPLSLYPSGLHEKEDFIFIDIETMGLFGRPIILFGTAQISGSQILINQYLLRDIEEEPAALIGFLSHINKNTVFLTFNGRAFDIPYIEQRLAYYKLNGKEGFKKPHFDILHFSRGAWKERVPNCRLSTLEKYLLGLERKDDVPGALIPEFYETYRETKNIGPLIPIIEHNKQDLVTLANIFSKLHEE